MKPTIVQRGVCLALYLGILILLPGPALAALNDHRSPDGKCNGVPEPPNPAGTPCEQKLCTNDGDWMCCKRCTASGGFCCEQIATSSSKGSGIKVPGGRLQKTPDMTTTAPSIMMPRTDTKTPIMRRGVEGEQTSEPATDTPPTQPDTGKASESK